MRGVSSGGSALCIETTPNDYQIRPQPLNNHNALFPPAVVAVRDQRLKYASAATDPAILENVALAAAVAAAL